jgi:hypothetical protein
LGLVPKTNIIDRYNAWRSDPDTPSDLSLLDAFTEGFAQCMEWLSRQPRERKPDDESGT